MGVFVCVCVCRISFVRRFELLKGFLFCLLFDQDRKSRETVKGNTTSPYNEQIVEHRSKLLGKLNQHFDLLKKNMFKRCLFNDIGQTQLKEFSVKLVTS